jgi:hypothetical protein
MLGRLLSPVSQSEITAAARRKNVSSAGRLLTAILKAKKKDI